jgi:hypothetical protein
MFTVDNIITKIGTPSLEETMERILKELEKASVYVGIPESTTARKAGEMTNAALLAIHTKGSPINHLPPRPVLEPAIEESNTKDRITRELLKAAEAGLKKDHDGFIKGLEKAGIVAQNASRAWFTNPLNGWPPDQPATIKRKLSKISGKKKREAALTNFQETLQAGGSMEGIDHPLIDTAQMRKAIVFLVEEN